MVSIYLFMWTSTECQDYLIGRVQLFLILELMKCVTGPDGAGQGPPGVSEGPGMGLPTEHSDGAEEEKSRGGADPEAVT